MTGGCTTATGCGKTPHLPTQRYALPGGGVLISNVQTCGRQYCPVCGPRIRSRRGREVELLAHALGQQGYRALRVDWTHAHDLGTSLAAQAECQRALFKILGTGRRALSQQLGRHGEYAGGRRALDYTYGAAGHHLHAHSVLFLNTAATLEDLQDLIGVAYRQAAAQVGLTVGPAGVQAGVDRAPGRAVPAQARPGARGEPDGQLDPGAAARSGRAGGRGRREGLVGVRAGDAGHAHGQHDAGAQGPRCTGPVDARHARCPIGAGDRAARRRPRAVGASGRACAAPVGVGLGMRGHRWPGGLSGPAAGPWIEQRSRDSLPPFSPAPLPPRAQNEVTPWIAPTQWKLNPLPPGQRLPV